MKICRTCGNQSPDDANFCDQCGARFEVVEAAAPTLPKSAATEGPAPDVSALGGAQSVQPGAGRCPKCGALNMPGEMYCSECGTPLAAPQPEPAISARPAQGDSSRCAFCGAPMAPAEEFCHVCGAQRAAIPEAPSAKPAESVAAPQGEQSEAPAGEQVGDSRLECPACGAEYTPGTAFCEFCGAALVGPQAVEQAVEAPQPQAAPTSAPVPGARLVLAASGTEIVLPDNEEVIVGREDPVTATYPDIDLTLYGAEEAGVSRRHFRIARHGESYTIEDLNSTNYTHLNRKPLQPGSVATLADGDEIRAGRMTLVFRVG